MQEWLLSILSCTITSIRPRDYIETNTGVTYMAFITTSQVTALNVGLLLAGLINRVNMFSSRRTSDFFSAFFCVSHTNKMGTSWVWNGTYFHLARRIDLISMPKDVVPNNTATTILFTTPSVRQVCAALILRLTGYCYKQFPLLSGAPILRMSRWRIISSKHVSITSTQMMFRPAPVSRTQTMRLICDE